MTDELLTPRDFGVRAFTLDDVTVRSDGDGRTVEAYCAAFAPVRAEIRDQDGHYHEEMSGDSFNKTIADNGTRFGVFYNHARTIYGTPAPEFSVPIGLPLEVRVDERGVFTATRYLDNPLADSVLDAIKQGAIRGQSFSGRFIRSTRTRAAKGALATITRHEVAMREYGPTVFPAYVEAEITGHRSVAAFLEQLRTIDPHELEQLRTLLGGDTPTLPGSGPSSSPVTPPGADNADEPHGAAEHSSRRSLAHRRTIARQKGGPLA